jgi:hypothetical protein
VVCQVPSAAHRPLRRRVEAARPVSGSAIGRVYVDRKLLMNCFDSSLQLPMESSGNLLNQDHAAPVRRSCRLYIVVALEPPSI